MLSQVVDVSVGGWGDSVGDGTRSGRSKIVRVAEGERVGFGAIGHGRTDRKIVVIQDEIDLFACVAKGFGVKERIGLEQFVFRRRRERQFFGVRLPEIKRGTVISRIVIQSGKQELLAVHGDRTGDV